MIINWILPPNNTLIILDENLSLILEFNISKLFLLNPFLTWFIKFIIHILF